MKNAFLILFFLVFIVSCNNQEELLEESGSQDLPINFQPSSLSGSEENEVLNPYNLVVDHFENNLNFDDISMYVDGGLESEFARIIIDLCDGFGENTTFARSLNNFESVYGLNADLKAESIIFFDGLIAQVEEDAYSVNEYFKIELAKDRNLSPRNSFILNNAIEAVYGVWHVMQKDIGILNLDDEIATRDDPDPLCLELVESLMNGLNTTGSGAFLGALAGASIGAAIFGPVGALVGAGIGAAYGAFIGWVKTNDLRQRRYAACALCLPPISILIGSNDGCGLDFEARPIGTGTSVGSLTWTSSETMPGAALGGRLQVQPFNQIPGSGEIKFVINAACTHPDLPFGTTIEREYNVGDLESQKLAVPSNAFFVTGNDAINIELVNGQISSPVVETYKYKGEAFEFPGSYDYEFLSVTNGTVLSMSSESITISWSPDDLDEFILNQWVFGNLVYRVTNTCQGGETKIVNINIMIYAGEEI